MAHKLDVLQALGDYIHSLGLKFGLYSDAGTATCAGFAGSYGHEDIDAQTFAEYGVDYLSVYGGLDLSHNPLDR